MNFTHKWWHKAGMTFTLLLFVGLTAFLMYAAICAPPNQQSQYIPLVALMTAFGFGAYVYAKSMMSLVDICVLDDELLLIKWIGKQSVRCKCKDVIELHAGSSMTGFGKIKTDRQTFYFCNWIGEARAIVSSMIALREKSNV